MRIELAVVSVYAFRPVAHTPVYGALILSGFQ